MLGFVLYAKYFDTSKLTKLSVSLIVSTYLSIRYNLLANVKLCPDSCYGQDLCRHFQTAQIQLTWFGHFLALLNPTWTKSVFDGLYNSSRSVVVKRKSRHVDVDEEGHTQTVSQDGTVFLCPGFRNFKVLLDGPELNADGGLWSNLNASIEPVLLLKFGNFSFPHYLGACGDLIVEEYKGEPLANFLSADFETRAHLAAQLLTLAHFLTFGSDHFIFYFTDLSLHNLVVDSHGTVSLVDLDSVIIYDRNANSGTTKGSIHRSQIWTDGEFSFSPSEICSHHLSDHNYFAVCTHLLTDPESGLLLDIPQRVTEENSVLMPLLDECRSPENFQDRISAGERLRNVLEKLTDARRS